MSLMTFVPLEVKIKMNLTSNLNFILHSIGSPVKIVPALEADSSQEHDAGNQSIVDDVTEPSSLAQPVNYDKDDPQEVVVPLDTSQSTSSATQHTQRDWLENLKLNFNEMIIQKCSINTKNAVENNKEVLVGVKKKYEFLISDFYLECKGAPGYQE